VKISALEPAGQKSHFEEKPLLQLTREKSSQHCSPVQETIKAYVHGLFRF
jgi:hypothetical protein